MNEARKLPAPSLDATIGANVHTLMWRAQHTQTAIAHELGMSQAALSLKLRGKRPWYADEIDHLARKYKVTHSELFTKLPELDSNQQPAGITLAPSIQGDELAARRRNRPIIERKTLAPVTRIGA